MAIVTNWYTMDNKEGVDLNNPQTISTTSNPDYPAPSAKLGDRVQGNYGSEWLFVQASTTVTAGMAVVIDGSFKANDATSALVASGIYSMGIAQFQASTAQPNDYFWALLKANGGVAININSSCNKGTPLFISPAVPGAFTSSVTSNAINNLFVIVASVSVTTQGVEAEIRSYMQPAGNMNVIGAIGSA